MKDDGDSSVSEQPAADPPKPEPRVVGQAPNGPREPDSVLLAVPRWVRDGGVAAHVKSSAELLARHGLDVRVVVARIESDEVPEGVTLYRSPDLFETKASLQTRLGEAASFRPSVTHLHQVDDPEIVQALAPVGPVVVSAHVYTACPSGVYYFTPGHECTRAHGPGCVANLLTRRCSPGYNMSSLPRSYRNTGRRRRALTSADLAISYSTAVDRHLRANGVLRRRIVPYFPTMAAVQGTGHDDRRRVVFAGRIVRPKGVEVLIDAAREVDAEFVVCGDGGQLEPMRKLARELGLDGRVSFTGWLDADELAAQMAQASVVVVPSLWPEPFGLVGIEALAAGRPVVATDTGGIGDWLDDGVAGLKVPAGDAPALARALEELLADPVRQRAMGIAGSKSVAARFSPERHLQELLGAYSAARANWRARG